MWEAGSHRAVLDRPSVLTELCLGASYQLASHKRGPQEEGIEEEPIRDMSHDSTLHDECMWRMGRERIVAVLREGTWAPYTFERCKTPLLNEKVETR